LQKPYF